MTRILVLALLAWPAAAQSKWQPLFDGKTLRGWTQCNGQAKYEVVNGEIVGTTAEGSPNSFLCTDREYGDFVLELEAKTDPSLNSGIQIRSHRYGADASVMTFNGGQFRARKHPAGRVHGYQVEIANEKSGASGGIYDEARRGWVANISSDPIASKAFKDNQWNRYRIEATGDRMRVWINDVPCADLTDSMDLTGFIALQVHSYKGEKPAQVRWRNIRIQDNGRHAWRPLWNGRDFAGWLTQGGGAWTVENGAIHAKTKPDDARTGFLTSNRAFRDATVRVKYKLTQGNSGFFVRAHPETHAGYEVEIDDAKGSGGLFEVGGRRWVAGPPDNAAVRSDDWNELTASVHGSRIVFHLNGVKTLDLADDSQGSKEGRVVLQVHGSRRPTEVWFKDVEVLEGSK